MQIELLHHRDDLQFLATICIIFIFREIILSFKNLSILFTIYHYMYL